MQKEKKRMDKNWCFPVALCVIFIVVLYVQSEPGEYKPAVPVSEKDFQAFVDLVRQDRISSEIIRGLVKEYSEGSLANVSSIAELNQYILDRWERLHLRAKAEAPGTELPKTVTEFRDEFKSDLQAEIKGNGSIYKTPIYKTLIKMSAVYHNLGYGYDSDKFFTDPILDRYKKILLEVKKPTPLE